MCLYSSSRPLEKVKGQKGHLCRIRGTGCFGPKQFRPIGPKHPFLQSLKFGMIVLAWADSSVPATCVGELHGPNHPS